MWWNFALMKGCVVCGCSEKSSLVQLSVKQLNPFSSNEELTLFSHFPLFKLIYSDVGSVSLSMQCSGVYTGSQ